MTFLVKVNTAHGPVVHIARGEDELSAVFDRVYANGPVPTYLSVQQ